MLGQTFGINATPLVIPVQDYCTIDCTKDTYSTQVIVAQVTCGSAIKLQHANTGVNLHSHEISYGSGSGQQSVTGYTGGDDANDYWAVRGIEVTDTGHCKLRQQTAMIQQNTACC